MLFIPTSLLFSLLPLALLPLPTSASPSLLSKNLNYRSPYTSDPALGLDVEAIHARHVVARRSVDTELAKRQVQVPRPSGSPDEYPVPNYGLGVADWGNAGYVYGGNLNFTHSVASGDPYDYSVLLWTRVYPTDAFRIDIPQCVTYKVYDGENGQGRVISEGYALTGPDVDYTVKVEADGLTANTWYSYQFANCAKPENKSPVGRTRTAPGKTATKVPTQRFAIYSCSNYPNGFFSAYSGPVVHKDADYVVHLGDYIYEYGTGGAGIGRIPSKGGELATLDDYRRRYDQYRTDVDLVAMHQNLPIIAIWDDHETANNDWKAGSSNSNDSISTNGCRYSNNTVCFSDRAIHAKRAYFEWIPIRQVDLADQARIFREFRFGDLVDILALDTRKYDRDITDLDYNVGYVAGLAQEIQSSRSIVGPKQEKWIEERLLDSKERGTSWRMILNQVIFGTINHRWTSRTPENATFIINYDAWDGYQSNRRRLLQHITSNSIDNIAIFTGDTHANWLFENSLETTLQGFNDTSRLKNISTTTNSYQPGTVVEYGGTAVSSNGWGNSWGSVETATVGAKRMVENNPSLLYADAYHRGYMTVSINYTHLETSWYEYPGNQQQRVPNNRTLAFRSVQEVGMNQVKRPLMQPRFGAVKPGN